MFLYNDLGVVGQVGGAASAPPFFLFVLWCGGIGFDPPFQALPAPKATSAGDIDGRK